jgi:Na+/H+-dicarboxylate symporter
MVLVFLFTGIIAAIFAISVNLLFTPVQDITIISDGTAKPLTTINMSNQLAEVFTVSDFSKLLSHEHILALIVFSILVGVAVIHSREKGKEFSSLLNSGEEVFMNVFQIIMYIAPLGFFSYFAVLVSDLGPKLMENYVRIAILYYSSAIFYFIVILSFYAYLAGRLNGIKLFWKNILLPMLTSIATCSSAASIPANLAATKAIGIAPEIYETTIPIGSLIHKDGSVMGGVFKIAFLFAMFQLPFSTLPILFTALGVSLLVGTVMGAIPSGGMLGELLILAVYGFPPSVLIAAAAISIIIDPIATMLNVTSNTVSTMMIAHVVEGKVDSKTNI